MNVGNISTGTKLALLALVMAVASTAFWFYLAAQVALPENRIGFVVLFVGAAVLGITAFFKGAGWGGRGAAVVAIIVGSFLTFTIAISRQEVADQGIVVGATMPQFTAPLDTGELFDSSSLDGRLVLIKFFRAHW